MKYVLAGETIKVETPKEIIVVRVGDHIYLKVDGVIAGVFTAHGEFGLYKKGLEKVGLTVRHLD